MERKKVYGSSDFIMAENKHKNIILMGNETDIIPMKIKCLNIFIAMTTSKILLDFGMKEGKV